MIKIENTDISGFECAIRGMRNPYGSWDKSDSDYWEEFHPWGATREFIIGKNDLKLMRSLAKAGNDHAKFARMINVTCDITAPLYWWKEFDTYKVGTVANSCSTMHGITEKEFTLDDFSCEHLGMIYASRDRTYYAMEHILLELIDALNIARENFALTKEKNWWWQIIQLLPSSYNQKRTVQLNYQVLWSMYQARKNHKLDEWREFCEWVEGLQYFKEIYLEVE